MRVGIIGYGRWAPNLTRNLAKHCEIAWVCDPSEDAQQRARDAGYVSRDAPEWDSADAVAVVTPIATHDRIARAAIALGKHVLCEKPLSTDSDNAHVLKDEAAVRGVTLMVSSPWLYHEGVNRMLVEAGDPWGYQSVRTHDDRRHLDPIADLLPHDIGIARRVFDDRICEVSAVRLSGLMVNVSMRTFGGGYATALLGYDNPGKTRDVSIVGPLGIAKMTDATEREPLDMMCAEFVACIREKRQPRYGNIDDAIHVAEVIEAAHRSVRERRVVTL